MNLSGTADVFVGNEHDDRLLLAHEVVSSERSSANLYFRYMLRVGPAPRYNATEL
jgi:hypothetical protein